MPREVYSLFVDVKRSTQFLMEWPNHTYGFVNLIYLTSSSDKQTKSSPITLKGVLLCKHWLEPFQDEHSLGVRSYRFGHGVWNEWSYYTWCFWHVCRKGSNSVISLVGCAGFRVFQSPRCQAAIFLEEMRVHVSFRYQVSARVHVLRSTRRGGVSEWLFLPPCVRFASLTMSPESCPRMRTCLKRRPEMHGILKCKCHAWEYGDWATLYLTKVSKWECEMNWIRHALLEGKGQRKDSFKVFNAVACSSAGRLDMAMRHFSGPATWSHFPSIVTFRHVLLRGIQNHACAPLESFKYIL